MKRVFAVGVLVALTACTTGRALKQAENWEDAAEPKYAIACTVRVPPAQCGPCYAALMDLRANRALLAEALVVGGTHSKQDSDVATSLASAKKACPW